MKTESGGTAMWCPECKKVTTCKAIPPRNVDERLQASRRLYKTKHADVHFFRRGRMCLVCHHKFLSAEAREDFLSELVELRDALAEIKRDAEQYIADSHQTAKSLQGLNESLGKLRALSVYQKQRAAANPHARPKAKVKSIDDLLKEAF